MIQIRHDDIEKWREVNEWYEGAVLKTVKSRQKTVPAAPDVLGVAALAEDLRNLSERDLKAILLFPEHFSPPQQGKRPFIDDLVDRLADAYPNLVRYIRECDDAASKGAGAESIKNDFPLLYQENQLVRQMFDYSLLSAQKNHNSLLRELKRRFGIPVCPYCNRQYIQTIEIEEDGKHPSHPSLGDADHIFPKYIYQLFSLSLWNFAPSCMPCNRVFKGQKSTALLNPHAEGFNGQCVLEVRFHDVNALVGLETRDADGTTVNMDLKWTVQPETDDDSRGRIENNLSTFRLNEIYQFHKEDARRLLRKRYLVESNGYRKALGRLDNGRMSDAYFLDPKLLYGTSLDPSRFQEEPLSKMTYDVLKRN